MTETRAIDPPNCGCTDCMAGYSVPLGQTTAEQMRLFAAGWLENRTGQKVVWRTQFKFEHDGGWNTYEGRFVEGSS